MMYRDEATWFALMNHLVDVSVKYVTAQVEAGAELIQIFRFIDRCIKCRGLQTLH